MALRCATDLPIFILHIHHRRTLFTEPALEKKGIWARLPVGATCGFLCSILAVALTMTLQDEDFTTTITFVDYLSIGGFFYSMPLFAIQNYSWVVGAVLFAIPDALLINNRADERPKLLTSTKTAFWILALSPILITNAVFLEKFSSWYFFDVSNFEYQSLEEIISLSENAEAVTIPPWLPGTAKNIKGSHNNDKTDVWMEFSFEKSDRFYRDCLKLEKKDLYLIDASRADGFEFSRYPKFALNMIKAVHFDDIGFFRCDNSDSYIQAIDHSANKGYIWKYRQWVYLEYKESSYRNFQEMITKPEPQSANVIPDWLPASAEDITTLHHSGANETLIFFSFSKTDAFYTSCSKIDRKSAPIPNEKSISRLSKYNYDHVCKNLTSRLPSCRSNIYKCDENSNRFLSIDCSGKNGIVWENLKYSTQTELFNSKVENFMDLPCL